MADATARRARLPGSLARFPQLDLWVRIDPQDTVTLFTGKVELGQGLRSALARIGADELDVAIDRVRVETADTAHGLDEGTTAGSLSIEERTGVPPNPIYAFP